LPITRLAIQIVALSILLPSNVYANDKGKNDSSLYLIPLVSLGLGYPQVLSFSMGGLLPNRVFLPSSDRWGGVRLDAELGFSGSSVSFGPMFEIDKVKSIAPKISIFRSWSKSFGNGDGQYYEGFIVDTLVPSHTPIKLGLGYYRSREVITSLGRRDYFFNFSFAFGF